MQPLRSERGVTSVYSVGNIVSDDRRMAICCVSLRYDYESEAKSRVAWRGELALAKPILSICLLLSIGVGNIGKFAEEAVKAIGVVNTPRVSSLRTFSDAQINSQPAIQRQCEAAEGT
eukprot:6204888-Pleurochrysis_carterae.AAC.4